MVGKKITVLYSEEPGKDPEVIGLFKDEKLALTIMSELIDDELDYLWKFTRTSGQDFPSVWENPDGKCVVISTEQYFEDEDYNTSSEEITYYIKDGYVY